MIKKTIALFVYDPKCSVQCCNAVIRSLEGQYNIKLFSKNKVEECFFDDVDMVVVPGGIGDADTFYQLFKNNAERVKKFVADGGKYIGICMGAYWAGSHYLDILDGIDTVQYIKRPNTDTKRPHAKNLKIFWHGIWQNMFFYDGCAIVGDYSKMRIVSKYTNDDIMAAIQGNIGLIGCHPEAEEWWYDSYSYMKGKYFNHQPKLLEFVNELMEK
jgi:glutamine amidotransferase-like uncharacterized protein